MMRGSPERRVGCFVGIGGRLDVGERQTTVLEWHFERHRLDERADRLVDAAGLGPRLGLGVVELSGTRRDDPWGPELVAGKRQSRQVGRGLPIGRYERIEVDQAAHPFTESIERAGLPANTSIS